MMGISFVKLFPKKARRPRISVRCANRISVACALQKMFVVTQTNKGVKEEDAIKRGLEEKAAEFTKAGEFYQKV